MVTLWIVGVFLCLILMIYLEISGNNVTEYKSITHMILTNLVIIFSGWAGIFLIIYLLFDNDEEERWL